jgi:hypothetical protein
MSCSRYGDRHEPLAELALEEFDHVLARQIDPDRPARPRVGPHQRVVGVLVGGPTGLGCHRVLSAPWAHRQAAATPRGIAGWGAVAAPPSADAFDACWFSGSFIPCRFAV